jgi:hypothetical protein
MAPLSRNYLGFQKDPSESTFFFAPDRTWLGIIHNQSKTGQSIGGAFARTPSANAPDAYVFDPQGDFVLKYGQRRKDYSKEPGLSTK